MTTKPPIGLMPKYYWYCMCDRVRKHDIERAMARYTASGLAIPDEWVEEYNEIVKRQGIKMNRKFFVDGFNKPPRYSNERRNEIISNSIKSCNWKTKCTIAMEEFAELQQEVSKQIRGCDDRFGLLEEMADAYICLEFLKSIFHISESDVLRAIDVKLKREDDNLKHAEAEKNREKMLNE